MNATPSLINAHSEQPVMFKTASISAWLALALAVMTPNAYPQTSPSLPPPPLRSVIDSKGINMIDMSGNIPGMRVSVGTGDSGIQRDPGRNWDLRDNFTGTLTQRVVSASDNSPIPVGTYITVSVGDSSAMFQQSGSAYLPFQGATGTFSCSGNTCQYVAGDGTVGVFDKTISNGYRGSTSSNGSTYTFNNNNVGLLTQLGKPDGEVINLTYLPDPYYTSSITYPLPVVVVSSASSSLGWMIKYQYTGNVNGGTKSVKAINTSVDYCDPGATACNGLTAAWPAATLTFTSNSQTMPRIVTDSLNNQYTCTGATCVSGQIPWAYTYTLPSGVTRSGRGETNTMTIGGYTYSYGIGAYDPNIPSGLLKSVGPDGRLDFWGVYAKPVFFADKLNRRAAYTYTDNLASYVSKVIDPDAGYTVSTGGSIVQPPNGGYAQYAYDTRGNITSISVVPKNGGTALVTSATYPSTCANPKTCNKPLTVTDQIGVTTSYTYSSAHGGVLTETKGSIQTRYSYAQKTPYVKNSSGSLVASTPVWRLVGISSCMTLSLASCVGSADELKTIIAYGTNNVLPVSSTVQAGDGSLAQTSTTAYDIYGNVIAVDGPRPGSYDATYYFYDALRRKTGEIGSDPDGSGAHPRSSIRITYNADSEVLSVEKGTVTGIDLNALNAMSVLEQHTTEYSSITGLAMVERDYAGGTLQKVTQKSYNSDRRVECVAQRLNSSAWSSLPSSACTLGSSGADGNDRITHYAYDAAGALLTTTSAYGTVNQRVDRTSTYDATNGLLEAETDAVGNKTVYTYDAYKRPYQTLFPTPGNGSTSSSTDYTQNNYTGALVSSVRLRDGQVIGFGYDALGRVSSKSGALSETFGYDNFNKVVSRTNNSTGGATSLSSHYSFNALGSLLSETRYANSTSLGSVSYGYDAYGRRSVLTWPDGFYITYDYNTNGYPGDNLQSIKESGGTVLASFAYDDYGRRATLTRGNGVVTSYGYDALSRLTSLGTDVGGGATNDISEGFGYTLAGQVKSRTLIVQNSAYQYTAIAGITTNYTTNALNQITSSNGQAITYDGRGNLTGDTTGGAFTYNANNLLTSAIQGGLTSTLTYDAQNRLNSISKSGNTTGFMYDGTDLIAETGAGNAIQRRFVHGPATDDPIVWYEGSGTSDKRYYTTDRQGSIVGITNQSGASIAINAYDEYGIRASANVGRFQYTGQTWLNEIGLYYYKARLYSPSIGRFMQTDPIGYQDDFNLYAYVRNDPLNRTDPSGQTSIVGFALPVIVGGAFIIAGCEAAGSCEQLGRLIADVFVGASRMAGQMPQPSIGVPTTLPIADPLPTTVNSKSHTTYTRADKNGTVYSGKTSGKGTPEQQVKARTSRPDHQEKTKQGYGPAVVDKNSPNADAIRGREQQLIEQNGGAQSQGGTSGNAINGVSPINPRAAQYGQACKKEFGPC